MSRAQQTTREDAPVPARSPRSQPVPVSEVVARTVAALTERHRATAMVDFPAWKTIVGARAARHAQPTTVRRGQVTIHAEDSAFLYELSLRAPGLLAGLRQALPDRDIRELVFSLGAVQW